MIGRREISESASSVPNNSVKPRLKPFLLLLPPILFLTAYHSTPFQSKKLILAREEVPSHPWDSLLPSSSFLELRWVPVAQSGPSRTCLPEQGRETGGRQGGIGLYGRVEGRAWCSGRWGRITCHSLGCGRAPRPGNHQVEGRDGSHSGRSTFLSTIHSRSDRGNDPTGGFCRMYSILQPAG